MTLIGGVVFGVFPATVVVATMTRRYLNGIPNITARHLFAQFTTEFLRSNRTGWVILLPLLALVYFCGWMVNNTIDLSAALSLAFVPVILMLAGVLFSTLIQMSIYQTSGVVQDIQNGLQFLFGQSRSFLLAILVLMLCVGVSQLVPILALFFYVSPALITAVTLIWLGHEHLQQLD
jgi:uncharacterized membrane protein YesL